jgi:hypothetical protein
MSRQAQIRRTGRWLALGLGIPAFGYAATMAVAWSRYGRPRRPTPSEADVLLDRFMPVYEVAERHRVRVAAPPDVTFAAAGALDLQQLAIVRAIFRARELVLGAQPPATRNPTGLLAEMTSLGWRILAEEPGREVVFGAVTQPWQANVVFRGLDPEAFAAFCEPGYVKIAWTLRVDPAGHNDSIFRTETRVTTTDSTARKKFRGYWARFSPGIIVIRRVMLGLLRADAERRAREVSHGNVLNRRRRTRPQRDVA